MAKPLIREDSEHPESLFSLLLTLEYVIYYKEMYIKYCHVNTYFFLTTAYTLLHTYIHVLAYKHTFIIHKLSKLAEIAMIFFLLSY